MISLAFQHVAIALMIAEANFFTERVGLEIEHAIVESDVRDGSHVERPRPNDFGGSIVTRSHFFGFGRGHLANFHTLEPTPLTDAAVLDRNVRLSKLTSVISTNGAYALATNWLNSLEINVPELERKYRLNVFQWRYYPPDSTNKVVMLPVYQVEWRGSLSKRRPREMAIVTVTILGSTKQLIEYHVLDDLLFTRRAIKISDLESLLSVPDVEFLKWTPVQRSNLVFHSTCHVPRETPP